MDGFDPTRRRFAAAAVPARAASSLAISYTFEDQEVLSGFTRVQRNVWP